MKTKLMIIIAILIGIFCGIQAGYACSPPPVAILTVTPDFTKVGETVIFDGNSSYADGKTIVKYEWDFDGDGTYDYYETADAPPDGLFDGITTHAYSNSGTYTVKFRVTDNDGLTGMDSCTVHIKSVHNITWDKWYGSIQLALNDAVNNDVIEVSEGTWNETIDFNGVNCVLRSTASNNYDIVVGTIINANGGTAVTFDSGEGSGAVLQGLTLTGGTHGISCSNSSSPTIKSCIVYGNATGMEFSSANSAAIVRNNTVVNNTNYGIRKSSGTKPNISNCIIWDCNDDLSDCNATYSCISEINDANGVGNITDDPRFVDAPNDNFHLKWNSPCLEAGDPNQTYSSEYDIDSENRVLGGIVDIGADEIPVIDVKDFGAEGDGVTDDSDAIQNVIDSSEFKVIMLKDVTFMANDGIALESNRTLLGVKGTLKNKDRDPSNDSAPPLLSLGSHCMVKNLVVDGNNKSLRVISARGQSGNTINDVVIQNCTAQNCETDEDSVAKGIEFGYYFDDIKIVSTIVRNIHTGIGSGIGICPSDCGTPKVLISHCTIEDITGSDSDAIYVATEMIPRYDPNPTNEYYWAPCYVTVDNCTIKEFDNRAMKFMCSNAVVTRNTIEDTNGGYHAIRVFGDSTTIAGNKLYLSGEYTYGVAIDGYYQNLNDNIIVIDKNIADVTAVYFGKKVYTENGNDYVFGANTLTATGNKIRAYCALELGQTASNTTFINNIIDATVAYTPYPPPDNNNVVTPNTLPWDSGKYYGVNDLVLHDSNDIYKCTTAHTNHEPPNPIYWEYIKHIEW